MPRMRTSLSLSERGKTTDYSTEIGRALDSSTKLQKLGEKFEMDKGALEARIKRIEGIRVPDEQKAGLISEIQAKIAELQQQYETDVVAEQQRIEKELESITDQMEEVAAELDDEAMAFKSMKLEGATDVDVGSAENAIAAESRQLRDQKTDAQRKMDALHQVLETQRNSIHSKPN